MVTDMLVPLPLVLITILRNLLVKSLFNVEIKMPYFLLVEQEYK